MEHAYNNMDKSLHSVCFVFVALYLHSQSDHRLDMVDVLLDMAESMWYGGDSVVLWSHVLYLGSWNIFGMYLSGHHHKKVKANGIIFFSVYFLHRLSLLYCGTLTCKGIHTYK